MANGVPSSPDGGVFVAGLANSGYTYNESFYTDIVNLDVGEEYVLVFYQSNAGVEGETPIGMNANWKISFGSDIAYSNYISYKGAGNQNWEKEEHVFVVKSSTQRLEFFSINNNPSSISEYTYMAIDGIYLYKKDCNQDTDNDGIIDSLDNDSDNDRCPDAIEGSGNFMCNDINKNGQLIGSVSVNGVPVISINGQGVGSSQDNNISNCDILSISSKGDQSYCKGSAVPTLSVESNANEVIWYLNGSEVHRGLQYENALAGNYQVKGINGSSQTSLCETEIIEITLTEYSITNVNIETPYVDMFFGDSLHMETNLGNNPLGKISWYRDNIFISNEHELFEDINEYDKQILYSIDYINEYGCQTQDSITISTYIDVETALG